MLPYLLFFFQFLRWKFSPDTRVRMEIFEFSFLSKVISVGRDSVKMELFNNNYPWSSFFLFKKLKWTLIFQYHKHSIFPRQKSISIIFSIMRICFPFHAISFQWKKISTSIWERDREGEIIFPKFIISERYSLHPLSQQITIYKPRYRTFYEGVGNFSGNKD